MHYLLHGGSSRQTTEPRAQATDSTRHPREGGGIQAQPIGRAKGCAAPARRVATAPVVPRVPHTPWQPIQSASSMDTPTRRHLDPLASSIFRSSFGGMPMACAHALRPRISAPRVRRNSRATPFTSAPRSAGSQREIPNSRWRPARTASASSAHAIGPMGPDPRKDARRLFATSGAASRRRSANRHCTERSPRGVPAAHSPQQQSLPTDSRFASNSASRQQGSISDPDSPIRPSGADHKRERQDFGPERPRNRHATGDPRPFLSTITGRQLSHSSSATTRTALSGSESNA